MGTLNVLVARAQHRVCRTARRRGFTLLELLIVVVIAGITLGLVTLNAMPSERQSLQGEAQRIALLMQLARDEAIVRNQPIAFDATQEGYRFLIRDNGQWVLLARDELLRERTFERSPTLLTINPVQNPDMPGRIVFGREPVDRPFVMTMVSGDSQVAIQADGIGHFTVE